MKQSRLHSLLEILVNTFVGMVGSWIIVYAVLLSIKDPVEASSYTVAFCTAWSLLRSWVVRRVFNDLSSRNVK